MSKRLIAYDEGGRRRLPAALARIQRAAAEGKSIGFTNGCFDILHMGHVSTFQALRKMCQLVIVGVNSDASVKILKGDWRPAVPEDLRAALVAGLRWVNMAIIFDEPTPLDLIKLVKPSVLVKGAEYGHDQVVGADYVTRNHGCVIRTPMVPGISSSKIIERIKKQC